MASANVGHIQRGDMGDHLDAGQKRTCVTFALTPTTSGANAYETSITRKELCQALGVDHNAAEYLGVQQINMCAMQAPHNGVHGFTFTTVDNSQSPPSYKPLETATRAALFAPDAAHGYHFAAHSNVHHEHEPLQLQTDSHQTKLASAAKRVGRWSTFLQNNPNITDEDIMKGCTTFQSPTGELFHAVPKLSEAHPDAGGLAHLCYINQDAAAFKKEHISKSIELGADNPKQYYVLNQASCNTLQNALKTSLKPQSTFKDGLRITALRFGEDATGPRAQEPLYATFAFTRGFEESSVEPLTKSSALQQYEGDRAKLIQEYKPESAANVSSKLAEQLGNIGIEGATVVKEHP